MDQMTAQPTPTPTPAATPTPQVVNSAGQPVQAPTSGELNGGAQAGIGAAIGVGNICCGPMCYTCPTIVSSIVGIVLYFAWKKEKPQTAKTILLVTIITGLLGMMLFGVFFAIGLAGAILDA